MSKLKLCEFNTGACGLKLCRDLDCCIGEARAHKSEVRYEYVRRLNVPQFAAIFKRCIKGERFDDVIDACIAGCRPGCREDDYPGCGYCMSKDEALRDPR